MHAGDAVQAELAICLVIEEYNVELVERSLPRLSFGVGVHSGEVIAAVVGSNEMMEFTVMGDVVNVASRIESLTRTHGVDILVTEAVRKHLDERFQLSRQPPSRVKGKFEPIATWAVRGLRE